MSGYGASPFCSSRAIYQRLWSGPVGEIKSGLQKPVGRVQCIEILQMPLGVRNVISLKGSWRVDDDADGSILVMQVSLHKYGSWKL